MGEPKAANPTCKATCGVQEAISRSRGYRSAQPLASRGFSTRCGSGCAGRSPARDRRSLPGTYSRLQEPACDLLPRPRPHAFVTVSSKKIFKKQPTLFYAKCSLEIGKVFALW